MVSSNGQGKYWERKAEKRQPKPTKPHAFLTQQRKPSSGDHVADIHQHRRPRTKIPQERLRASEVQIPKNFRETTSGMFAGHWWGAMDAEMSGVRSKATWTLMALRSRTEKVLQSKRVDSVKTDAVGNVLKFKARIVAVGSSQEGRPLRRDVCTGHQFCDHAAVDGDGCTDGP